MTSAYEHPDYNYKVVRQFAVMTVVWGVVGMLVGVLIAAQLAWPALNFDTPWLSFGRLRPLHTNAVILPLVVAHCLPRHSTSSSEPARSGYSQTPWQQLCFGAGKR